jgi:hypothetical protein
MNRIGFISVNHFGSLTHEVGFHLHITPTVITIKSIQTDLTQKSIRTEKGRKKEKRGGGIVKSFLIFLVEKGGWMDTKLKQWG